MESIISDRELKLIREHAADVQNVSDQPGPVSDPSGDMPRPTKRLP